MSLTAYLDKGVSLGASAPCLTMAGESLSYGEVQAFRSAEVRPLDVAAMATLDYDITRYQPVLFAADSFAHAHEVLATFFAGWDDDAHQRLLARG